MKNAKMIGLCLLLWPAFTEAQLVVTASPVKAEGNKALVKLDFRNDLTNAVESARATVFLLNGEAVVGQGTKWVIGGGKDKSSLPAGGTNSFFFVITSGKSFPRTNLTAKVNVERVVLEGGTLANPAKDVVISSGK
ncbi:MAG TPA: hypothetical protein VKV04_01085 [Verrucomicrobiae bacterium]|nr:hypothetical protein [Verrucomicrobiae bacterium]